MCFSFSSPDVSRGRVGPQMKKFEQVSSDHHQMSQAGGGGTQDLMSGEGWGYPRSDVQEE